MDILTVHVAEKAENEHVKTRCKARHQHSKHDRGGEHVGAP